MSTPYQDEMAPVAKTSATFVKYSGSAYLMGVNVSDVSPSTLAMLRKVETHFNANARQSPK
jgi:hypothetical protein